MKNKLNCSLTLQLLLFLSISCANLKSPPQLNEKSNCSEGQNSASLVRLNLICSQSFQDQDSAVSMLFPASQHAANFPDIMQIYTNDPQAVVRYTINDESVNILSAIYAVPFSLTSTSVVRYFSIDESGNTEQIKLGDFQQDATLPNIQISNLSSAIVKENTVVTIDVISASGGLLSLRLGGNGQVNGGQELTSFNLAPGVNTTVTFNSDDIDVDLNRLYFVLVKDDKVAHSSFYVWVDVKEPFVQAIPDGGFFSATQGLQLKIIEPATIYYTIDFNGTIPSDPDLLSTVYNTAITLPENNGAVVTVTIKYFAVDLAGNQSDIVTKVYKIDKELPILQINSELPEAFLKVSGVYYLSSKNEIGVKNEAHYNFSSHEDGLYQIEINGIGLGTGKLLVSGSLTANNPVDYLLKGSDLITENVQFLNLYVADLAGNQSSHQIQVALDNTMHGPAILKPLLGQSSKTSTVTFVWQNVLTIEALQNGSGLEKYEIQVDTDFTFATNPPPTDMGTAASGNLNLTLGNLYYWRLRAVDNVGNKSAWSGIRNIYVGKAQGDFDNNQIEDFIVGAPGEDSNKGRAYLYSGTNDFAAGFDIPKIVISGASANDQFGYKVVLTEDLNGGGFADVVIAAPFADSAGKTDNGKVYVFYGENFDAKCASTYPCNLTANQADVLLEGETGGDFFGRSLSYGGDYNKDGLGDFIVGATGANVGNLLQAGKAYLFLGGATNSGSANTANLIFNGNKTAENFSSCLAYVGDANGDGVGDIFIGASNGDTLAGQNTGVGYLFFGGSSPDNQIDVTLVGSENAGSGFGSSCARGFDVDGDGYEDFLVGAPFDPSFGPNFGKAFVYFGGSTVLTVPGYQYNAGASNGQFATAVLGAYFNADQKADFIIGAPNVTNGQNFMYDGSLVCNPQNCTPSGVGTPVSSLTNLGAVSLGIWGSLVDANEIIAVGDTANSRINLLKLSSGFDGSPYNILARPSGGAPASLFGFSISTRP